MTQQTKAFSDEVVADFEQDLKNLIPNIDENSTINISNHSFAIFNPSHINNESNELSKRAMIGQFDIVNEKGTETVLLVVSRRKAMIEQFEEELQTQNLLTSEPLPIKHFDDIEDKDFALNYNIFTNHFGYDFQQGVEIKILDIIEDKEKMFKSTDFEGSVRFSTIPKNNNLFFTIAHIR